MIPFVIFLEMLIPLRVPAPSQDGICSLTLFEILVRTIAFLYPEKMLNNKKQAVAPEVSRGYIHKQAQLFQNIQNSGRRQEDPC